MNKTLPRTINRDEVDRFHRDGVILLKNMFDAQWIDILSAGLEENLDSPTYRSRVWDRDTEGRTMFWDSQAWREIDQYRQFVFESPAAQIAAQLLRATTINFFFDAVFIRSAGSQFSTPWHQDEPYWSIEGYDTCTIWMPLVPVESKSALGFVPGSHRADTVYHQYNFGELNPDKKANADQVDFSGIAEGKFPDIDADPDHYGVVNFDMAPGDCVVFNSRTIHGGSGKLAEDRDLRVFSTKWLGDDVRIKFRSHGMDPDHSAIMTEYGLKPGDRPGTELYPKIWPSTN